MLTILSPMKTIFILIIIMLTSSGLLYSQQFSTGKGAQVCAAHKLQTNHLLSRSFRSAHSPVHSFDVLNYTINIDLVNCLKNPYPHSFVADVKIRFRVDSTLSQIVLDANTASLSIDSVSLNGISYSHAGDQLEITLDRVYSPGEQAEVQIYYKHADIYDGAFYASGGFAFTDCEPEGARKWVPCYDKPSDKATTDITANVPSTCRLGSNGRLQDSIIQGNNMKYHWVSRDPVSTYLIVLTAKVNFKLDIVNWTNPNTSEIIPLRFYYNAGEDPSYIKNIIGDMTTFYSEQFGDQPFEKNGFATLNSDFTWGGMENQSLTSLCPNCWDESLVAHEYAHQWFGDMITCATWADIFLNEGFATWSEAHWTENQYGYAAYKNELQGNANYYISENPHWAISPPSWAVTTPDLNTLFNYAITYMKGSCVLHMLRYTLGDEAFFPAFKAYATDTVDFKFHSATIEDFKNKMELESGQQLDWFFDQWVYKPDHPVYQNVYEIKAGENGKWSVFFTAKQEIQQFIPYFQMPVELKINFKDGSDTLVKVFNSFNGQIFAFEFNKEPSLVKFDPNNEILLKDGTTLVGLDETLTSKAGNLLTASPVPFSDHFQLRYKLDKPANITIDLYNSTGVKMSSIVDGYLVAAGYSSQVKGGDLKAGIYFVVLRTPEYMETLKIIKKQ